MALLPTPFADARPLRPRLYRIGRLAPNSRETDGQNILSIRTGLAELGWQEHKNFTFKTRYAAGRLSLLPKLAADLIAANVDVILAGSNPGVAAAKSTTRTVPIIMVTTGDPIAGGLIASLAKPGGNITGVTALGQQLGVKRLEILREAFPALKSVALLVNPASPYTRPFLEQIDRPAHSLGFSIIPVLAGKPAELDNAFSAMTRAGADALFVMQDVMFITHRKRIIELALGARLPAIYGERSFAIDGGLMFYGASLRDMYKQSTVYIDKVLNGAKPADLPVQLPTRLNLVVNITAAKALGLELSPSMMLRTDEVIE